MVGSSEHKSFSLSVVLQNGFHDFAAAKSQTSMPESIKVFSKDMVLIGSAERKMHVLQSPLVLRKDSSDYIDTDSEKLPGGTIASPGLGKIDDELPLRKARLSH